ncbi:MAG: ABC transporter substrate-binding protein [Anaerolineae bacterium]|nr:ABC transporter substrate-binding protein [Anaerolineae bacterium]MDW8067350.1 ABC transporter substrate-binding protein [Anaerolineae bacterium]
MKRAIFVLGVLCLLSACAWGVSSPTPSPLVVTDALGREVTLAALPQRLVVAGKATIMIVDALYLFPEGPQRLAAVGSTGQGGDFLPIVDPNAAAKATLSAEAGPEQIAAAGPDLVILKSYLREKLGAPVEALGIPVFYVSLETPEQYLTELRALGQILGNPARAEEVIAFYQERMERVRGRVAEIPDDRKPRVLVLQHSVKGGETAYSLPPAAWMQTRLVGMAGGHPVWLEVQGSGWTVVTLEQIAAWDPDQVYVIDYFGDPTQAVEKFQADPVARNLRAMQSGQVFAFPKDTYSWDQPDTRWILGLQWLAAHIHPDLFADLDIFQEFTTFYRTLYRLDDAAIEGQLRPLLKGSLP